LPRFGPAGARTSFSPVAPEVADIAARGARVAVALLFFTNGVLFANVWPRYPEIRDALGIGNAELGAALAAFPLGAIVVGLAAAGLIARFRSAPVATGGLVLLALDLVLVGLAPSWATFAVVLFVAGSLDAIVDVAQNTHGLRVQRLYGRSVVNSFHGIWSVGAVAGGLMGSMAAALSVPLEAHLAGVCVLFSGAVISTHRLLLGGPDGSERPGEDRPSTARVWRRMDPRALRLLLPLGVLAACGALVEDAGASWGAIYMREELGAGAGTAGLGLLALMMSMTIGRLLGDRVVDRFGQRAVVRAGGALTAAGMAVALALPSLTTTVVGYAAAGLGVATLVPAVMHTADEIPGLRRGAALTLVSWFLRIGFLLSPLLVGFVADAVSLRVGLLGVVVAGVVVVALGRVLVDDVVPSSSRVA
jgi:MFS family permease